MTKIISIIMTIVLFFSGQMTGISSFFNALSTALTGAPLFSLGSFDSFSSGLDDENIVKLSTNTGYVDDILLVFMEKVSLFQRNSIFKSVDGRCIGFLEPANLFVLQVSFDNLDESEALCEKLMQEPGVVFASGSFAFKYEDDFTPNDPFDGLNSGSDKWDESNPGGSTWWLEAIDARNAWGYSDYFNHINIGIVDSGFETNHPELDGKIVFPSRMLAKQNIPDAHGTHVSGIIAAKGDNGEGISGICQNSTLTCVDWEPEKGQLWIADLRIIFGVGYAVKAGAKVVNLSVGASGSIANGKPAYPELWMDTEAALVSVYTALLVKEGYDFVIVQSAGNGDSNGNAVDAFNNGSFCCITEDNSLSKLVGVPAKDILDRIIIAGCARNLGNGQFMQSSFSNVGSRVDICAPGSSVYSCSSAKNNYYQYMSGTSMAAPVITAIASLVWSVNPALTGAQVKAIVCDDANTRYDVPETSNHFWATPGFQTYRLVNAKLAVEAAIKTITPVGTVKGRAVNSIGQGKACEIIADTGSNEYSFCAGSDGYFEFILPPGEVVINLRNSDSTLTTINASVTNNQTLDLTNVVIL